VVRHQQHSINPVVNKQHVKQVSVIRGVVSSTPMNNSNYNSPPSPSVPLALPVPAVENDDYFAHQLKPPPFNPHCTRVTTQERLEALQPQQQKPSLMGIHRLLPQPSSQNNVIRIPQRMQLQQQPVIAAAHRPPMPPNNNKDTNPTTTMTNTKPVTTENMQRISCVHCNTMNGLPRGVHEFRCHKCRGVNAKGGGTPVDNNKKTKKKHANTGVATALGIAAGLLLFGAVLPI
jgi:ribosomal protein L37AE/L43A